MTTINNSENLIVKVGGIEKARRIAFDPLHPQMTHVSNDGRHWVNEAFAHIPEIQCQIESMIRIDDLCTAIAEHDSPEFKVGDLVVYHSLPHKRLFKVHNKGGDSIVIRECWDEAGARCFAENSPYVDIRHATPSEIKAGHRIDDNTDHVTDIRNHVSPSTIIKDLEAERHG